MRNDVFCPDSFRLNAPGGLREGFEGYWLPLNSQIHRIHKEKEKKVPKKRKRKATATTIFVSQAGNSNCRQREIIIDARQLRTCQEAGLAAHFSSVISLVKRDGHHHEPARDIPDLLS
jgi:hypothetical protein